MEFEDLILKRRSCRSFKNEKVDLSLIKEIINESILAPS